MLVEQWRPSVFDKTFHSVQADLRTTSEPEPVHIWPQDVGSKQPPDRGICSCFG